MRSVIASLAVLCCLLSVNGFAYTGSGNITTSETWSSASTTDTLRITGDIVVTNNATLTISPGTLVKGYNGNRANVRHIAIRGTGVIYAVGTAASPIVMVNTYFDIEDMTRDSLCLLKYIKFSEGWGEPFVDFRNSVEGGGQQSKLTIENCTFERAGYCQIYVTSGGCPTCNYCTFVNNPTNTTVGPSAVFIHGGGTSTFNYCTFANFSAGIVSASYGVTADPWGTTTTNVSHCTFYNITGENFDAGVPVANGYGICTVNRPGVLTARNNIFYKVDHAGIRDWTMQDDNFCCPQQKWTVNEDYNCYYQIGGDPLDLMTMGTHSKELDPKLTAPATNDFSINNTSPAWNTASDGKNMGAWQAGAGIDDVFPMSGLVPGLKLSSHVLRTSVDITLSQPLVAPVMVCNSAGVVVRELGQAQALVWDGQDARGLEVPNGMYYVLAQTATGQAIEKIVKVE